MVPKGFEASKSDCTSFRKHGITVKILNGPRHAKTFLRADTDSEGQDQPAGSAQSDQCLRCPLTESLDTIKCINGEQIPRWDFAQAWDESKSVHFAHARRHLFAWRGQTLVPRKQKKTWTRKYHHATIGSRNVALLKLVLKALNHRTETPLQQSKLW